MTGLFQEYRPGDSDPCFYCTRMLTYDEMQPTAWGDGTRENVCDDCRAEEVANGGWMIRTPQKVSERLARRARGEPEKEESWLWKSLARLARVVGV